MGQMLTCLTSFERTQIEQGGRSHWVQTIDIIQQHFELIASRKFSQMIVLFQGKMRMFRILFAISYSVIAVFPFMIK